MMTGPYLRVGMLFGALALVMACSTSDGEVAVARARLSEGCARNSDCDGELLCVFERCHVACASARDCDGRACVAASPLGRGVCQQEAERACARNVDCPGTQLCGPDGQCRDACANARDCRDGETCAAGACVDPPALLLGSVAAPKAAGASCRYASDCAGDLVCLYRRCDLECVSNRDCIVSWACLGTRCRPPGTTIGDGGVFFRELSLGEVNDAQFANVFDGNLDTGAFVGNSIGDIAVSAWTAGRELRRISKIGMRWGAIGENMAAEPYPHGTAFQLTLGRDATNPGGDPPPAPWTAVNGGPPNTFSFNADDLGLVSDALYHEYVLPQPVEARSAQLVKVFNQLPIDTFVLELTLFE